METDTPLSREQLALAALAMSREPERLHEIVRRCRKIKETLEEYPLPTTEQMVLALRRLLARDLAELVGRSDEIHDGPNRVRPIRLYWRASPAGLAACLVAWGLYRERPLLAIDLSLN